MDPTLQAIISAIATFILISLIFTFIILICRTTAKRQRRRHPPPLRRTTPTPDHPTSASFLSVSESQLFDSSLNEIQMVDLVNATRNFSPELIVGDGSFGLVYRATLAAGVTVAVKKLSSDAFQGYREFRAEMETLGRIRHDNIVKFFGYCATGSDRILIYEFIEKGSLDQWLYDTSSTHDDVDVDDVDVDAVDVDDVAVVGVPLCWDTRIGVMRGVAKGLAFMHGLERPIIHRDIKASNVLLDADFKAHIADFGLARRIEGSHLHVSTQVAGTMGYMPPEYIHGATAATVMGDVYSFGILMIEVATAMRPNWPIKSEDGKEIRLVEWAARMVSENREMKMLDVSLAKEDTKEKEVLEFFRIAMLCTNEAPKSRPSMNQVVKLLNQIQEETRV